MSKQQKAAVGFVGGVVGLVVLQSFVGKEAKTLGVPHLVAGVIVAVAAHKS
jgi:hypothetical protein